MPTLTMTKGIPGSGKSSWSLEQVKNSLGQTKRVNKDTLRAMIDAGEWRHGKNEKAIEHARDALIRQWMSEGFDIIVDDTNLASKHEIRLRQLAKEADYDFRVKDFTDVPLHDCLARDAKREGTARVGEAVILGTYEKYLMPKPPIFDPMVASCVICDLDGTLCLHDGRSPYEEDKVETDKVNPVVLELLRYYDDQGVMIVLMSGRSEAAREGTERWLKTHNIPYDFLYMRKKGDTRKDYIVKRELYDRYVNNRYNVTAVIDDRKQVCLMWKYMLNLPLLYVGNFVDF